MAYYKIDQVTIYHDRSRRHEPYYAEVHVEVYRERPEWWESNVTPERVREIHVHLSGLGISNAKRKIEEKLRLENIVNGRLIPEFTCSPCVEK